MSSMIKSKKIYVFDFDGVICDSSVECLIVSWNAWQKFFSLSDYRFSEKDFEQNEKDYFFPRRPFVKGAGEYFPLWQKYFKSQDCSGDTSIQKFISSVFEREKYKEIFYECREELQDFGVDYWLGLHIIYFDLLETLKLVNDADKLYIATLKDKASVSLVLSKSGLRFPLQKIFDQSVIDSKLSALDQIAQIESVSPNNICFFDDNPNHLLEPKKKGYSCFLASWSVRVPDFLELARENSIDVIKSTNLVEEMLDHKY